ncbi:hypothetical protein OSTOST_22022 [Ostertagia ostertagi]
MVCTRSASKHEDGSSSEAVSETVTAKGTGFSSSRKSTSSRPRRTQSESLNLDASHRSKDSADGLEGESVGTVQVANTPTTTQSRRPRRKVNSVIYVPHKSAAIYG